MSIIDPASRVDAIISSAEPHIRDALTTAIAAMKENINLEELMELIEFGRIEEALELATTSGAIRLSNAVLGTYVTAGNMGSKFLDDVLKVEVNFNQVNARAVEWMQQERLRMINGFNAEQLNATRTALSNGIARGDNPLKQAKAFKDSIGLTERQVISVEKYRSLLEGGTTEALSRELRDKRFDPTVRIAATNNEPLSAIQVDRMVDRYRENFLKFRAETIARTEALRAVHSGNWEAYAQAVEDGFLTPFQLERMWVTAGDEKVRGSHRFYGGQKRGMDEKWGPLRYPGDPTAPGNETINCRCSMTTRIVSLGTI